MSGATTPHRYAMTYGTAEGRVVRGHFGTPAMTPIPGLCATTYRVRAILTEGDGRGLARYEVPGLSGSTHARERAGDRTGVRATFGMK